MPEPKPTPPVPYIDGIDLMRGLAAQLVLINHMRAAFFVDFQGAGVQGALAVPFYLITGFGHQAVIVFFVLSGYLVGGAGLRLVQAGRFHAGHFFLRRLARLWIVLLPALVLTMLIDGIGGDGPVYQGQYFERFASGPAPGSAPGSALSSHWAVSTLLGNAFFLQTIHVPTFGTNSPLWSLANEFWYYAIFIFGLIAWGGGKFRWARTIFSGALVVALIVWLPVEIAAYFAIWMFGALVAWAVQRGRIGARSFLPGLIITMIFLGTLLVARLGILPGSWPMAADFLVGSGSALMISVLIFHARFPDILARACRFIASYSFTLYLIHFPLVMAISAWGFDGGQMAFTPISAVLFLAIFAGLNAVAYVFFLPFENQTRRAQDWSQAFVFGTAPPRKAMRADR